MHHLNFRELTGGRWITIYAQTEIVKDLIAARTAAGAALEFEVTDTAVSGLDSARPVLSYTDARGERHVVTCDVIAGCDGFHGITRRSIPAGGLTMLAERSYPYAWLGILAAAPPSTDEVNLLPPRPRVRAAQHAHPGDRQALPSGCRSTRTSPAGRTTGSGRSSPPGSRCPAGR